MKLNVFALANTFAVIDIVLHVLFRVWIFVSPNSYEWVMNVFVAGFRVDVTEFDVSIQHIILGTGLEVAAFWVLGAAFVLLYNKLSKE